MLTFQTENDLSLIFLFVCDEKGKLIKSLTQFGDRVLWWSVFFKWFVPGMKRLLLQIDHFYIWLGLLTFGAIKKKSLRISRRQMLFVSRSIQRAKSAYRYFATFLNLIQNTRVAFLKKRRNICSRKQIQSPTISLSMSIIMGGGGDFSKGQIEYYTVSIYSIGVFTSETLCRNTWCYTDGIFCFFCLF